MRSAVHQSWRRLSRLQRTLFTLLICIALMFMLHIVFGLRKQLHKSAKVAKLRPKFPQSVQTNDDESLPRDGPRALQMPKMSMPTPNSFNQRQVVVVNAFKHSWKAYKLYAWGHDEVHPLTRKASTWMGAALTMVDALDTMWLMGMKEEFQEARNWIATHLKFDLDKDHVSVFETTIRLVGGLMSVYHLTGDKMFLEKAVDLGDRLSPAFDTPSSVPRPGINLARRVGQRTLRNGDAATAEVATLSLEFIALARASGQKRFKTLIDNLTTRLHQGKKKDGLVPIFVSTISGQFRNGSNITLGARGDSYYEYLLKQWLLTNKTVNFLIEDYKESVQGMKKHLLRRSRPNNLLFAGELTNGHTFSPSMDHLVCFLPGTLAYGYLHGMPEDHLRIARQLMSTCYEMYRQMPTGLSPEIAHFNTNDGSTHDIYVKPLNKHNLQRPETVESLYYMSEITKERKYRDWGWRIFQAFEKYTRLEHAGYVSISDVTSPSNVRPMSKCESFWLAETLKYFFLLFSDHTTIDLKRFVFNTEAHPLPLS